MLWLFGHTPGKSEQLRSPDDAQRNPGSSALAAPYFASLDPATISSRSSNQFSSLKLGMAALADDDVGTCATIAFVDALSSSSATAAISENAGSGTAADYSITSSARCRNEGGIVRPSALAVLRLTTSSNFVGCSTGKLAGLAPLRILST